MQLVYVVAQSHCVVIERFGKFSRIQRAGIRFRLPMVENVRSLDSWGDTANKEGWVMELTEQQTDTPSRQCHTKDNVPITANASVYWRITDPRRALYEVDILPQAVADIALNALRSNIGALDLDTVLSERQELNQRISAQLSDTAKKWGILFTRVEIQELKTAENVSTAMLQQMDAERRKRAFISEAEGQAEAKIKLAEAQQQSDILIAQGKAKALALIAKAEGEYLATLAKNGLKQDAVQILVAQKYLDGFETISKNPADKVFLPNSFKGLFSIPTDSGNSAENRE
jgi:regulator of protease activity HflC (stomatin/prohibitin superfamily)